MTTDYSHVLPEGLNPDLALELSKTDRPLLQHVLNNLNQGSLDTYVNMSIHCLNEVAKINNLVDQDLSVLTGDGEYPGLNKSVSNNSLLDLYKKDLVAIRLEYQAVPEAERVKDRNECPYHARAFRIAKIATELYQILKPDFKP